MCDCKADNEIRTSNIELEKAFIPTFRIISEMLICDPSIYTIEKIATKERFNLTAAEIFKQDYIYFFAPGEIVSITYCYAEYQFNER